jgi:hypothetical protein
VNDQPNNYLFKSLLYLDIFVGSLFARDPDITISSYCGLALRSKGNMILRGLGHTLNFMVKGHCEAAIVHDRERAEDAIRILKP